MKFIAFVSMLWLLISIAQFKYLNNISIGFVFDTFLFLKIFVVCVNSLVLSFYRQKIVKHMRVMMLILFWNLLQLSLLQDFLLEINIHSQELTISNEKKKNYVLRKIPFAKNKNK